MRDDDPSDALPTDTPILSERVFRVVPSLDGDQAMVPTEPAPVDPPKPRGFAAMTPAQRSAISSQGGRAAHTAGTAHRFTSDEAKAAGRKGGKAPKRSRRAGQPTLPIR